MLGLTVPPTLLARADICSKGNEALWKAYTLNAQIGSSAFGGKPENICSFGAFPFLTRTGPQAAISGCKFCRLAPFKHAHIAGPAYGTLVFAECSRITEVWSEVDAAGRGQQLTRRAAGAPTAIGILDR